MTPEPNDPTRAGAPVPEGIGPQVRLSMTELETLAAKAARGAGLDWGLAEEAGVATRWLQAHGFEGAELLLHRLERSEGTAWRDVAPVIDGAVWHAEGVRPLCPIATGTTLSDHSPLSDDLPAEAIHLQNVDCPAMLLPFLSAISHRLGTPCAMDWAGTRIVVSGDVVSAPAAVGNRRLMARADVQVSFAPEVSALATPVPPVRRIAIQTLRRLNDLSMRTTVPASEQSRQGAGAGTSDND